MFAMTFGKRKHPCGDCWDNYCTMNCGPRLERKMDEKHQTMYEELRVEDIAIGDFITSDGVLPCLEMGKEYQVHQTEDGQAYIICRNKSGKHLLEGHIHHDDGVLLGFTKHRKAV